MKDEFTARQRAITLRLAGRPVTYIGSARGRTEAWFHKGWRRYLEFGADGRSDLATGIGSRSGRQAIWNVRLPADSGESSPDTDQCHARFISRQGA